MADHPKIEIIRIHVLWRRETISFAKGHHCLTSKARASHRLWKNSHKKT